ncbi:MAG: hypothetical protein RSB05_06020 [Clostridiales bacterium]
MKKTISIIIIFALALLAFGCMSSGEKKTQNNIMSYLDSMESIEKQKSNLIEKFMVLENSNDNEEILSLLNDEMLPLAQKINDELTSIPIKDKEITPVHKEFTDGWSQLIAGLESINQGLKDGDIEKSTNGTKDIDASQDKLNQYYKDLETLCTKYAIKLTTEE